MHRDVFRQLARHVRPRPKLVQLAIVDHHPRPYRPGQSLGKSTAKAAHSSLDSFLKHAKQSNLSPSSTVYVGTEFEYLCQDALRRLGFDLVRTGGRSDLGIDLAGSWSLPQVPGSSEATHLGQLKVLVQCKALQAGPRPQLVRELEGMQAGAPSEFSGPETVAVLCSTRPATKGVRDAIRDSPRPLAWVQIHKLDNGKAQIRQMLWNDEVDRVGLRGVTVSVRRRESDAENSGEVVLIRQ